MTGTTGASGAFGKYDDAFFDEVTAGAASSAEVIVPLVVDALHPRSVLDVGCGLGTWLAAFARHGVDEIVGIDGPHVDVAKLEMPRDVFVAHDLREPISLGRRFDLVVSLEVAEHLEPSTGPAFVGSLVAHGDAVLFSAAVPFQGGAGHVNEQWPSYWAECFATHGYRPVDLVRPAVWGDERVAFWYAQNTVLYVATNAAGAPALSGALPFDVVHPQLHVRDHTTARRPPAPPSLSRLFRQLPGAAARAVRSRTGR